MLLKKRFNLKERSWIMYDWANSIYATNIMAAIYPTIFASLVSKGDIYWGYATSAATLIMALLAPFLGALADYKGYKKSLFTVFALMGIIFTPLMAFFGNYKLMMLGYVVSRIGFSGSCLFYDSFLTDVTTDERMDKVSSWGYAMGYIGGSTIPFVISIALLLAFDYNTFSQVFSVLIVSAWWLVFSIPMFKNVDHEHYIERPEKLSFGGVIKNVVGTFKSICKQKGLLIFIIAYFLYIDGVDTIISISTAYGTVLGLGSTGMILALLATQIIAVPCSIWFAQLTEKFSARKGLIFAVALYLIICLLGFYMGYSMEPSQDAYYAKVEAAFGADAESTRDDIKSGEINREDYSEEQLKLIDELEASSELKEYKDAISVSIVLFWIMACLVGTVQGGIQAVSRSYYGKLIPKERSNEYYGFFDIFGKFASFLGPFIYSSVSSLTGHSSYGVIGLAILFAAGLVLLIAGKKPMEELTGGN